MAITAPLLWLDGAMVPSNEASIALMGHAAQRGSLVFDVGAFHATSRGPALFRVRDHVARFMRSARIVGLEVPFDEDALARAAVRVVAESGLNEGLVRWSVFYAAREPDLIPRDNAVRVAVAAQSTQDPPRREPIRVAVFDDARKAAPEVLSPETKASGAYLGPMLARKRAIAAGADDVVLLDRDGDIAEGRSRMRSRWSRACSGHRPSGVCSPGSRAIVSSRSRRPRASPSARSDSPSRRSGPPTRPSSRRRLSPSRRSAGSTTERSPVHRVRSRCG